MSTKLIVLVGFMMAFSAGLVTGLESRGGKSNGGAVTQVPTTTQPTTRGRGGRGRGGPGGAGMVARELNLDPAQAEKMQKIWSEVAARGVHDLDDRRSQLRLKRETDILALVPPEQRDAYKKIQDDFTNGMASLDQEWRNAYDEAVQKTKEILTPEQRTKYEEILKRNQWDRGRGGGGPPRDRGGRGPGGRGGPPDRFDSDHSGQTINFRGAGSSAASQPSSAPK